MENYKTFLDDSYIHNSILNKSNADLRAILDEINAYYNVLNTKKLSEYKHLNSIIPAIYASEDENHILSLIVNAVHKEIVKRFYTITADNEQELNVYNKLCCNDSIYYVNTEYNCIEKGTVISIITDENNVNAIKVSFGDNDVSTFPSSCFGKSIFTNSYTAMKYL